jgi:thiamine-phosphate pyrophosphorylase
MEFDLPRLYAITDRRLSGLSHFDQVARLMKGGATLIQLRDKDSAPDDLYQAATRCIQVARPLGVRIIINDRADVALAADADGVHLGQDDLPAQEARRLLGSSRIVGVSTHTVEQAVAAASSSVDYVAIGPVFATSTKANPDAIIGPGVIAELRRRIEKPLVAIGGITLERARDVILAGADSVAVISDLYSTSDIAVRTVEFIERLSPRTG